MKRSDDDSARLVVQAHYDASQEGVGNEDPLVALEEAGLSVPGTVGAVLALEGTRPGAKPTSLEMDKATDHVMWMIVGMRLSALLEAPSE